MTRWAFAMATTLAAAGLAPAAVTTKVVEYEFDGTKLKGFLAYDDAAKDKRPGVMVTDVLTCGFGAASAFGWLSRRASSFGFTLRAPSGAS